mmetsp:Transcript_55021/g.83277  ORF Transcript_55021/g.83277 Transcript_55021/m.83277 type:complete len:97 (+) Transcript_55021:183-473(+)
MLWEEYRHCEINHLMISYDAVTLKDATPGNPKDWQTDRSIRYRMRSQVGTVIVDNITHDYHGNFGVSAVTSNGVIFIFAILQNSLSSVVTAYRLLL